MEWMDIYDEKGDRTGKKAARYTKLPPGEFFLCAHIVLENLDGGFLIQQRSAQKPTRPGAWDITAGAVDAGEDSLHTAIREASEEVGLSVPPEKVRFLFRARIRQCYHDVYYAKFDFSLSDCKMQEAEVQQLRLVSKSDLLALVDRATHRSEFYKTAMHKALEDSGL